ncbi:MAG TPA: right-handed parallel beta-helix repeat-containing protein, partial [Candidatus Kapabacteria bacterium]|nr:right-handed parallel beta-helix repeat-containing protein [Candidatus Kapabacteria bacterium]
MRRTAFVTAFLLGCALPLFAAKYYIDPNLGVDSHTRAQARISYLAWRHIQTGIDSAAAGDTLSLADAIFPETITITKKISIFGRINTVSVISYPSNAGTNTVVTIASGVDGVVLKNLSVDGRYQFGNGALNGIWCNVGVDSLQLIGCAIRNCGASGLHTSFDGTPDGAVNDGYRIENCFFQNILDGEGVALRSCCVWGDHLSHAYIRANFFELSGIGLWLSGSASPDTTAGTGNVINANVMQDLMQNGLVISGVHNSSIDSNIIQRCASFAVPDSVWSRTYVGAVCFAGNAANVTMIDNVVRDNRGYAGQDTFYKDPVADTVQVPGYSGWPGMFFSGNDTVNIQHGSVFNNHYGGVYISGSAPRIVMDSCFIYSNGELNDSGKDYGISAPFANVDARRNWWGINTGPVYDGNGVGNGIYGDSVAYIPVMGNSIYNLTYQPQRIIFLIVHIGQYEDTTFDFYNAGPGPAFTRAPFIGGDAATQFSIISPTSPQIVEPFDTLHVTVHFQPTEVGLLQAIAAIETDSITEPYGPELFGFGGLAELSTNDSLAFDTLAPGRCVVKTISIRNIGTELLGIGGVSFIGIDSTEFSVQDSLPIFIPSGAQANLHVAFCP